MVLAILLTTAPAWASSVEDMVADKVRAVLPAHLGLVAVELPATAPHTGAVAIEWRGKPRAGRSSVLVKVGERKLWARITLAPLAEVAVARRPLAAGAKVTPDDVTLERRPAGRGSSIAGLRSASPPVGPSPAGAPLTVGATVVRDVAAGATITPTDVDLGPPEPRGQPLRVVARAGGVEVAVAGQLEQPARIGERAVARLADGSRLVRGRLVAPGIFVVEADGE
jgi:flagella basal body P-ring formation protein FlgA